jgi:hypothetical protein
MWDANTRVEVRGYDWSDESGGSAVRVGNGFENTQRTCDWILMLYEVFAWPKLDYTPIVYLQTTSLVAKKCHAQMQTLRSCMGCVTDISRS